jgi:hypothetical protein
LVAQRHVGEALDFNVALTGNEDVRTPAIIGTHAMSDKAEAAAIRLWRDRAHLREHERDEAQARARIAEKVAILTAENDRLADEIARLRALLNPGAAEARAETEQQMKDLKTALLALLDHRRPYQAHRPSQPEVQYADDTDERKAGAEDGRTTSMREDIARLAHFVA